MSDIRLTIEVTAEGWTRTLHHNGKQVSWSMREKDGGFRGDRPVKAIVNEIEDTIGWTNSECEELFHILDGDDMHDITGEIGTIG